MRNGQLDPEKIGRRLRELRGLRTRVGVAREMGIAPAALSHYECGRRVPSDAAKVAISRYYNVPVQELFFDEK